MKALITLLIIGTSSAAFARPVTVDHRYDQTVTDVTVRDHRDDMTIAPPPAVAHDDRDDRYDRDERYDRDADRRYDLDRGYARAFGFRMRPVTLASNVSLLRQRNRDQRPLLIDIDSRVGYLKKIRLDRIEGRAYVDAVVITFSDGHRQTVDVNQMLSFRSPSLMIDLDHAGMTSIAIYGMTERGRASFNVIGLRR